MDLALNNLQRLMCHETHQTNFFLLIFVIDFIEYFTLVTILFHFSCMLFFK